MNAKCEGLYRRSNLTGTPREQSSAPNEFRFSIDLFQLIKNKHNMHQIIKNMVKAIIVLYNRSQEDKRNYKQKPKPAASSVLRQTA